ncbi:hypothetical protein A3K63_02595 [Candidatus Micrarchaeota archaeon RBG_16_49_10]|nr:MAG: hypothetical protein A3K63_02595 [Candidatus Micrarchaeota archaeon RBG_16_49_10]
MEKEYWLVILCGFLSGLLVFGGKVFSEMGLSLYQISVFPSLMSTLLLFPYFLAKKGYKMERKTAGLFVLMGLVIAFVVLAQYGSVIVGTPVAVTVLLLYTQPVWTIIFSKVFLKERISKMKLVATAIVLAGMAIIVNPLQIQGLGGFTGIFLALGGGFFLAGWTVIGRVFGKKNYDPVMTKFVATFVSILFLLALYPAISWFSNDRTITGMGFDLPFKIWVYLFLFEVFAAIIPQVSYYIGTRKVSASDAGIILLLEPVSASLLAMAFLGQALTANVIVGGALILLANYLVIREKV